MPTRLIGASLKTGSDLMCKLKYIRLVGLLVMVWNMACPCLISVVPIGLLWGYVA